MTWVVFDPVADGPLLVRVSTDRSMKDVVEKSIIGCATEEKAREVLVKMFGNKDGWLDHGRFIIREGTDEQLEELMQGTGVRDIYDGERVTRR